MKQKTINQQLEMAFSRLFRKYGKKAIWDTLRAPEYMSYWSKNKEWPVDFYSSFGVELDHVHFTSSKNITHESKRFSKKAPLYLAGCKVERAKWSKRTKSSGMIKVEYDNVPYLNDIMRGVCKMTDISMWTIYSLTFFSDNRHFEFKHFNPDGNGAFLYFFREIKKQKNIFYPEIGIGEQQRICKGFHDGSAHCHINKKEADPKFSTTCILRSGRETAGAP